MNRPAVADLGAAEPQFAWFREAPASAKRALFAAAFGWMLDSYDVMLFSLVLAPLMRDLHLTKTIVGIAGSATLVAAAVGGVVFGVVADRRGRTFALRWSILIYAAFTAACGLAHTFAELLIFRACLGLGMGGEWGSGAALVSETWPARHLGKALGWVQSSWAVGYALAVLTAAIILPRWGWRPVFFVGLLPALFTIWIRKGVEEPPAWKTAAQCSGKPLGGLRELFRGPRKRLTIATSSMNACTLFAWWGFNLWLPAYLALGKSQGGAGFSSRTMTILLIVMQAGMWFGYLSFGVVSDAIGRKRSYVSYLLIAAAALLTYSAARSAVILLVLGPAVAFFGTGYFTGFGAVTAELYDTSIRATAQGFTYNVGRLASAVAPFAVGTWAQTHGFPAAFRLAAAFFLIAAAIWVFIPETYRIRRPTPFSGTQLR